MTAKKGLKALLASLPAVDGRKIEKEARRRRAEKLAQVNSAATKTASVPRKAAA